jgi:hypothetical protein
MFIRILGGSAALALLGFAAPAWAQAAHQHGLGTINIAFDDDRMVIELHAPGVDIVGFERPPQGDAEQQTLARATAALKEPLALLTLPAAARCTVNESTVVVEGMGPTAAAGDHTEFEAAWVLRCADVAAIRTIGFGPLFQRFANAQEFDVTVLTARGPSEYEITRAQPVLDRGNSFWRWLTGR